MFDVISKREYWAALDDPLIDEKLSRTRRQLISLKHVQDAWVLSHCARIKDKRILEVGGGFGRVLRTLEGNERWNLDPARRMPPQFTRIDAKMGEFSNKVPSDYFDVVFSISVIEHVPISANRSFWQDHARVLRPGGVAYHAIDLYLGEDPNDHVESRLDAYLSGIEENGLSFIQEPSLARPTLFRPMYATNPDLAMRHWNSLAPRLRHVREDRQSVSLGMGAHKPI